MGADLSEADLSSATLGGIAMGSARLSDAKISHVRLFNSATGLNHTPILQQARVVDGQRVKSYVEKMVESVLRKTGGVLKFVE